MGKKIVGIDNGYGHVKTKFRDKNGVVQEGIFESIVGNYDAGISVEGFKNEMDVIEIDGEKLIVGRGALKHSTRILNGRDKDWIMSTAYRALFLAGLYKCECNAVDLLIMTGLPVTFYKSDKARLEGIIRELAHTLCLNLTVKVIPQPCGAFFSLLFDSQGQVAAESLLSGRIGVLDIGFYTSDLVTLDELEIVDKQIGSYENGVSTALDMIIKDVNSEFGTRYDSHKDLHKIEPAARTKKIKIAGVEYDISRIVNARLDELADEIKANARTTWKNALDLDQIVLCGGGAALLGEQLKNLYPRAVIIDEPQLANVRGYFNFGEHLSREG